MIFRKESLKLKISLSMKVKKWFMVKPYLFTLRFSTVTWRILKILRLKKILHFIARKNFLIDKEINVFLRKKYKFQSLKSPYYNEHIEKNRDNYTYVIGKKSKLVNFNKSKLDSNDYIFDYLVWYRNWLIDFQGAIKEFEVLVFWQNGIATYPHPISNTIINYILIYDKLTDNFGEKRITDFLTKCYNKLVLNTEEYTGGNHLVDNYIALLAFSKFIGEKYLVSFWNKKLARVITEYGLSENNIVYSKLILWKINSLHNIIGDVDALLSLKRAILKGYPFLDKSILPLYNDSYLKPQNESSENCFFNNDRYFYYTNDYGLLVFFLKNGMSKKGNHGHDHDSSLSLQVWVGNCCVIGSKGTSHYSYDNSRNFIRKRSSGTRFFPDSKYLNFISSFRVKPLKNQETNLEGDIESFKIGLDKLKFSYAFKKDYLELKFNISRDKSYFKFYSDLCWTHTKGIVSSSAIEISGVIGFKQHTALRFNGLYDPVDTHLVGLDINNEIQFKFNLDEKYL